MRDLTPDTTSRHTRSETSRLNENFIDEIKNLPNQVQNIQIVHQVNDSRNEIINDVTILKKY